MAGKRCVNCGATVKKSDAECPYCGTPVYDKPEPEKESPGAEEGRLVACRDCGKMISFRAPVCPHCGAPRRGVAAVSQYVKPDWGFEWRTRTEIMGYPLIHVAFGRKNGKLRVAKGIIAIGQFALGLITFAQFGVGILFGFGQFIFGITAIAQFAITLYFGMGQFATGYIAIGQFALGYYALGQIAIGKFIWKPKYHDAVAKEFFLNLARSLGLKW